MTVCVTIIRAGIGTEAAHYCMGHTSPAGGNSVQTIWESLLMKGVLFEDVPKCITIMCVVLIKHNNYHEMLDLC